MCQPRLSRLKILLSLQVSRVYISSRQPICGCRHRYVQEGAHSDSEEHEHFYDTAVLTAELPLGTQVTKINPHGANFWTRTARLDAEHNGEFKEYFLKVCIFVSFHLQ